MAVSSVLVGDRVRWISSALHTFLRGEVVNIFNALNEEGEQVDFYHIEYTDGFNTPGFAMISETELESIQFKVIFRDVSVQIARGEKVI